MTALEARTLAVNLMRALLAVPGAKRAVDLVGEAGIQFVEALGSRRSITIYSANQLRDVPHVLTIAVCYAAHKCQFYAAECRDATPEECATIIAKGAPSVSVCDGGNSFHFTLGADLAP